MKIMNITNFISNYGSISSKYPNVDIIVVTKYLNLDDFKLFINDVQKAGIKDLKIGENRAGDAYDKFLLLHSTKEINSGFKKYLIGHLQTNKAKKAVAIFDIIESVGSLHLAQEIDKQAKNIGKIQEIYLQINISKEDQKSGFILSDHEGYDGFLRIFEQIKNLSNLRILGLMCIAKHAKKVAMKKQFKRMKIIFDDIKSIDSNVQSLSMGMSGDYEIAIEEGATEIRLGTILFV